jgi:xanthine dehydrogenase molybdopterin-binding subunit B
MKREKLNLVYQTRRLILAPNSNFDRQVRRLGGGYGGKSTPSQLLAAAAAIAANKVHRPVRVVLDMRTNMEMFGKRLPYLGTYKVRFEARSL